MDSKLLLPAFKASTPALFGYISLGMSFGFIFQKAGAAWYLSPLMSLLVYAGAAQFVAVSLLAAHGSLFQILSATFVINLRHVFYGISFLGKFPKNFCKKMYMIFGLTDESYSILTSLKNEKEENFSFFVILFSHLYWIIGSLIGSVLGASLSVNLKFLEFTLTILFITLSVEQAQELKNIYPILLGISCFFIATYFCPHEMLILAIALSTIALLFSYKVREVQA